MTLMELFKQDEDYEKCAIIRNRMDEVNKIFKKRKQMMRKKPMLAYPVNGKPVNYEDKIFVQPKLDGVRCVIQYENRPLKNVDDLSGKTN